MKAWIRILWIVSLSSVCPGLVQAYQPGDHELLLTSTAARIVSGILAGFAG